MESARTVQGDTVEPGFMAPSWISEGLNIEKIQAKIRNDIKEYGNSITDRQSLDLYNHRVSLSSRISTHQNNAALFIDLTLTSHESLLSLAKETDGQPEHAALYLPSHLLQSVSNSGIKKKKKGKGNSLESHRSVDDLVGCRHAECFETLRRVHTACSQKAQMIAGKNKNACGEVVNTQDYNTSFEALQSLGVNAETLSPLKSLSTQDLTGLTSILSGSRPIGEGKRHLPWFWQAKDQDQVVNNADDDEEINEGLYLVSHLWLPVYSFFAKLVYTQVFMWNGFEAEKGIGDGQK
ncbi:hypothetical protein FRC11_007784, partial [Ceratobasidium sp. 423]